MGRRGVREAEAPLRRSAGTHSPSPPLSSAPAILRTPHMRAASLIGGRALPLAAQRARTTRAMATTATQPPPIVVDAANKAADSAVIMLHGLGDSCERWAGRGKRRRRRCDEPAPPLRRAPLTLALG